MSLGNKLKENIAVKLAREQAANDAKKAAIIAQQNVERSFAKHLIENIKEAIVIDINNGKIPRCFIKEYHKRNWVIAAIDGRAHDNDLWDTLNSDMASDGIKLTVSSDCNFDSDDEDWLIISAEPL